MHAFGEGFGQTVGQGPEQDGGIIILGRLERLDVRLLADAGGDDKAADIIGDPDGAMKSASARLGRPASRAICWRSVCRVAMGNFRALSP